MRLGEFSALSSNVASAVRVGMPAWKPVGLALNLKLLIAVILLATGLLCAQVVRTAIGPSTNLVGAPVPCKVHAINGKAIPPQSPPNRVQQIKGRFGMPNQ